MGRGNNIALAATILFALAAGTVTGIFGLTAWALALNGFMGSEFVVNVSLVTYLVPALLIGVIAAGLAGMAVYRLTVRRGWNSAWAAAVSTGVFSILVCVAHVLCVIVSVIAANVLRSV